MQFGQRTQNAAAGKPAIKPHGPRKPYALPSEAGPDLHDQAVPSAARLAAEAAFAGPTFSVIRNGQTQVTVRRARNLARLERPAQVSPPAAEHPVAKGPRVFRIDSARVHTSAPTEPAPQHQPGQTTDTQALPPKTRRRRAPEQRPGPVVRVVPAPAIPRPTPAIAPAPKSRTLVASLAQVTPILTAIERAQSLQFIDSSFESHYQRLSRQADVLLKQLKRRRR